MPHPLGLRREKPSSLLSSHGSKASIFDGVGGALVHMAWVAGTSGKAPLTLNYVHRIGARHEAIQLMSFSGKGIASFSKTAPNHIPPVL